MIRKTIKAVAENQPKVTSVTGKGPEREDLEPIEERRFLKSRNAILRRDKPISSSDHFPRRPGVLTVHLVKQFRDTAGQQINGANEQQCAQNDPKFARDSPASRRLSSPGRAEKRSRVGGTRLSRLRQRSRKAIGQRSQASREKGSQLSNKTKKCHAVLNLKNQTRNELTRLRRDKNTRDGRHQAIGEFGVLKQGFSEIFTVLYNVVTI